MHLYKPAILGVNMSLIIDATNQLLLRMPIWQSDSLGSSVLAHSRIHDDSSNWISISYRIVERLQEHYTRALASGESGCGPIVKGVRFPFIVEQPIMVSQQLAIYL